MIVQRYLRPLLLLFLDIFLFIDSGHKLKVLGSISANTGIAFQCNIAVAVAHILHGVTITSSPGSMPTAPTAAIKPEVHELTVTACFTLKYFSQFLSNFGQISHPKNLHPNFLKIVIRHQI